MKPENDRVPCRTPDEVAESATYKALVKALRRGTEQLLIIIQACRTLPCSVPGRQSARPCRIERNADVLICIVGNVLSRKSAGALPG